MSKGKAFALVAAGLVAGLVLGSIGVAGAATAPAATSSQSASAAPEWCPSPVWRAGQAVRDAGGRLIDIVADLTGLSTDQVAAKRADGQSFEQIAESEGVSSDDVVAEALKVRKELLDQKVEDGTITQQQADAMLENMKTRLTERVTSTDARGGGRGGMGRGRMGASGFGGACGGAQGAPASPNAAPSTY